MSPRAVTPDSGISPPLRRHVRILAGIILSGLCMLSPVAGWAEPDSGPPPAQEPSRQLTALNSPWRRTAQGWQRKTDWPQPQKTVRPAEAIPLFHPGLLAAFMILVSVGALLAAEPDRDRPATRPKTPRRKHAPGRREMATSGGGRSG